MRQYPGQTTPEVTPREEKIRAVARRDAAEGRRLPHLTAEKLDESVVRLISAALICEAARRTEQN